MMMVVEEITVIDVTANITSDVVWESGKVYVLTSRIAVESGATLTIQPGVIVKGEAGTGANATALLVARGGTIMAVGNADAPIIFTSIADNIEPGQIESPNLDPSLNGLWGGLIILGNAPISADEVPSQIEGIPPSDQNGLYGGDDAADNSGMVKFVSIRHGGANIGEGNEINGLTLGGVGSGTGQGIYISQSVAQGIVPKAQETMQFHSDSADILLHNKVPVFVAAERML